MSVTFRVLPQPGSVGAQRNQIAKKNQQIVQLREQVSLLRQQLNMLRVGGSAYAATTPGYLPQSQQFPMSYPANYAPTYQQPQSAWSGLGQLFGNAFSGVSSLVNPSPSYYTPQTETSWQSPLQVGPFGKGW